MTEAEALKERLQKEGRTGIALDIDETLANSNSHWFDHLHAFRPLSNATKEDIIKQYPLLEEVPDWNHPEMHKYMHEIMNSNEFNEGMTIIEDANHIVAKINAIVPVVAYITARPETVREGTLRWLAKHGFPEATLIMRPSLLNTIVADVTHRSSWKVEALMALFPEVAGIVDDNPNLAKELASLNYPGKLYFYGAQSAGAPEHPSIIACPTWPSVLAAIDNNRKPPQDT